MKIENSAIRMGSQHRHSEQRRVTEELRVRAGPERADFEGGAGGRESLAASGLPLWVSISAPGRQAAARTTAARTAAEAAYDDLPPFLQLLISVLEALTGKKIKLIKLHGLSGLAPAPGAALPPGSSIEYDRSETLRESEQTRFSAQGVINTADHQTIRFDLAFALQSEFVQSSEISSRAAQDPLVLNFDGTAAQLGSAKFSFDLDSDGRAEQISFVGAGSGFLALDKNGDGKINDGSELFGPQSGNGFADLAGYDSNGDHWIDEADAVYSKLKIWSKDASGHDTLSTLAQRQVGALYLGHVATAFALRNGAHELQGQLRSTGIYVREDGKVGALQQVDLVV